MRIRICATANYKAGLSALVAAMARDAGIPGIILVHGTAGFGKTCVMGNLAIKSSALFLTASPLWKPRWMLSDVIRELGGQAPYSTQSRYEFIVGDLRKNPRPVFIDEADVIAKSELLVETLRAIHDQTAAPIVLIGMEQFKRHAAMRPQLNRRIIKEVEFKPSTFHDSRLMALELAEVQIADDLVEALHRKSRGSAGLFVKDLAAVEGFCRRRGLNNLALADYPLDDLTPPPPAHKQQRTDLAAAA